MNARFAKWIEDELAVRGWSQSEAGRRGEIASSMINLVVNRQANPGLDFCRGIARAFNLPLEDVLRRAEILPPLTSREAGVSGLLARLAALDTAARTETLTLFNAILDYRQRQAAGAPIPAANRRRRSRVTPLQADSEATALSEDLARTERAAQFRALFASLSDEEQTEVLTELEELLRQSADGSTTGLTAGPTLDPAD